MFFFENVVHCTVPGTKSYIYLLWGSSRVEWFISIYNLLDNDVDNQLTSSYSVLFLNIHGFVMESDVRACLSSVMFRTTDQKKKNLMFLFYTQVQSQNMKIFMT